MNAPPEYAELHAWSNFTFLEGADHPETMVARAAALGYEGIALTDRDGLHAAVRLGCAAKAHGIHPIFGSDLSLEDGCRLTFLVESVQGYRRLSRLITQGRLNASKGESRLEWKALDGDNRGLILLTGSMYGPISRSLARDDHGEARRRLGRLLALFSRDSIYLELGEHHLPVELKIKKGMITLAREFDLPLVATQHARYATKNRRPLHDILTCIRHHTTLEQAGTLLLPNAEFYLHSRRELGYLFRDIPQALKNTITISRRCTFQLNELDFVMPDYPCPPSFGSPMEYLEHLTFSSAPTRFPEMSDRVVFQLRHELEIIGRHQLEGYFLIVWDIMRFCHEHGILAQGRGSAANSAVCYSLGITNVDPIRHGLLFERFLSEGRSEPPDIDLDIANDRREEVIQYVYRRYGRDHAAMVCEVITFRARSAIRDVGKALGLSITEVDKIAKEIDFGRFSSKEESKEGILLSSFDEGEKKGAEKTPISGNEERMDRNESVIDSGEKNPDTDGPVGMRSLLLRFCREIEGYPRHLSIHVGGMVISARPLAEIVPMENARMPGRTVIQWDKDDVGALNMPKIDLLGLGMLSLIGDALKRVEEESGRRIDPARLDYEDPAVYRSLSTADTLGLFQIESRAQMAILPRMKPRTFYDLVIQVSLIRPGPIQGDMVQPYLRRREGREAVSYPHPDLEPVLARTLGIPLFQEQGMKVAIVAAGFSPAEADALRRAMSSKRGEADMHILTQRLFKGMRANGYDEAVAHGIVNQIRAFSDYGFPESHAASFALIVYLSAWLKHYHPLPFYVSLLNNQPMGFYSSASIVSEMRRKGIKIEPIDISHSQWDWSIEGHRVRVGLKSLRGVGEAHRRSWEKARAEGPWRSIEDVCLRLGWPRLILERMASVGAFSSLGVGRREAVWKVQGCRLDSAPTKGDTSEEDPKASPTAPVRMLNDVKTPERNPELSPMSPAQALTQDLKALGHSSTHHPIEFLRPLLTRWKAVSSRNLHRLRRHEFVRVAGVVIVRQRPPTAKGFCFLTLEDEFGMMNIIIDPERYEEFRPIIRRAMIVMIGGRLRFQGEVIHIVAEKFASLDERWAEGMRSRDFR